jgi:hypothetical protein
MALKQIYPGAGSGGGGGEGPTDEQLAQIGGVANDAKNIANGAKTVAADAAVKADAAKTAADGYSGQITGAVSKADAAKAAADAAAAAASTASGKADAVTATAADAKSKAEAAQSAATTASGKADAAKATADGLDQRVTVAEGKATAAKTAADNATALVGAASSKADAAKTAADDAAALAGSHESRIDAVESTANGFGTAISEANANSAAARLTADNAYSLADGLSDAVEDATAATNAAAQVAATAKATADTTKTAVDTLKITVDANGVAINANANKIELVEDKADAASAAASAATQAANDATTLISDTADRIDLTDDAVDALTTRVATLETNGGGGGTGPAYDDTAIKGRVTSLEAADVDMDGRVDALEADNTVNKSDIGVLKAASAAAGAAVPMEYLSVWGDSRTAQNWNSSGSAILARGYAFWAEALSGRVRAHQKYNFGVSGDSIQQLLDRINNDTANAAGIKPSQVPPSHAVLHIGTNSINSGVSVTNCMAQLNQIINWLMGKGHTVYVVSEWPRGLTATGNAMLTADNQKIMYGYAREIRKLTRTKKIKVIDAWPAMADPTLSTAQPRLGYLNGDGLHPSIGAGFITGKLIAKALEENNAHKIAFPPGSQDLYDAVSNKEGSLSPNPMLRGTGGVLGTGAATGVAPDGWTITPGGGLSAVGSQVTVTMPDGTKREAFRIVISGTASSANANVYVRIPNTSRVAVGGPWTGKIADGDIIEGWAEIIVADGFQNLSNVTCNIASNTTPLGVQGGLYTGGGSTGDLQWPENLKQGFSAIFRSPELLVTSAHTTFQFEVRPYFLETGLPCSLTLDILSAGVRKKTALA